MYPEIGSAALILGKAVSRDDSCSRLVLGANVANKSHIYEWINISWTEPLSSHLMQLGEEFELKTAKESGGL